MNFFTLTLAHLRFRRLNSAFNILILALGVATIVALLQLSAQLEQRFTRDLQGIDLVVGAKGSPLQLILSTVFHLDIPTGNIPLNEAQKLAANPLIKTAIPLALGDNYNGFRIVGTTTDYISHYGGRLAQGRLYGRPMEAVLGSEVAQRYPIALGGSIIGAHGLVNSDDLHSDFPYTVTGILAPTGSVLDRLVLTPVESVWHVHEHPDPDDAEEMAYKHAHPEQEITALLIAYKTPMAAVALPRSINKSTGMQAASPAFELARLLRLLDVGSDAVRLFGALLVALAALGFFITLWSAVQERRYELALLRSLGASRAKISVFVLAEGLTLGVLGTLLGLLLGHALLYAAAQWLNQSRHLALESGGFSADEAVVALIALAISALAAIVPAIMAYRVNVAKILAQG